MQARAGQRACVWRLRAPFPSRVRVQRVPHPVSRVPHPVASARGWGTEDLRSNADPRGAHDPSREAHSKPAAGGAVTPITRPISCSTTNRVTTRAPVPRTRPRRTQQHRTTSNIPQSPTPRFAYGMGHPEPPNTYDVLPTRPTSSPPLPPPVHESRRLVYLSDAHNRDSGAPSRTDRGDTRYEKETR